MADFDTLIDDVRDLVNGNLQQIDENYLLKVPIENDNAVDVFMIRVDNAQSEMFLKCFTVAGKFPATIENLHILLKNNMGLDYGSFATMMFHGHESLVVCDSWPVLAADPAQIARSIFYMVRVAFDTSRRMAAGLPPL